MIHFRQVQWLGASADLPRILHRVLISRPNVEDTVFERDGERFEVRHRAGDAREMRLHLASHIPGALKPISPAATGVSAADLGEAGPPPNSEFTEREIALVVRASKLGYVTGGTMTHPRRVESALRGLISLDGGAATANRLVLSARADAAMIAALMAEGVDQLDLGLTLPSAEADQVVAHQPVSFVEGLGRAVGQEIMTRLTADHEEEQIDVLEDMTARLRLKLRKRKPTVEQIENLTALAQEAIEDDEGFRIRTVNKVVFTRDKLLLKSQFEHPSSTTLRFLVAWPEIANFLDRT